MIRVLFTFFLLVATTSCSPIVRTHGNLVDESQLGQIRPGVSREADVVAVLGTPTAEGTFTPNEWYYIGQITKQTAFLAPKVSQRDVVRITFDTATGTVSKVERLDKSAGNDIALVSRTTPTAGHNLGVVEQILGNVGRFNPPEKK